MLHTWANEFRTYADACRYYGADTTEQLEAEAAADAELAAAEWRELEAAFGPYVAPPMECPF